MSTTSNRNLIDTERQFSLGLLNDAFHLGYHCWWILSFVLSFGLFTIVLGFVSGVLDTRVVPADEPKPTSFPANTRTIEKVRR